MRNIPRKLFESLYQSTRFEYGAWSLFRVDKGLRYGLKSLFHVTRPQSAQDESHHRANLNYLENRSWLAKNSENQSRVKIGAVGDLMWVNRGWEQYLSPAIENRLSDFDLRFANLETPVDPSKPVPVQTYSRFNAPVSFLKPWQHDSKHSILSIANNHALDCGVDGFAHTREQIQSYSNLHCVGGLQSQDALCMVKQGAHNIAVISVTYGVNPWGHKLKPSDYPEGLFVAEFANPNQQPNWKRLESLIQKARAHSADLIVLMPHWGFEFEYWPGQVQRWYTYRLIEMGIDVILGSSPHVLQPLEIVSVNEWDARCPTQIKAKGPSRAGIVAYSLGNFISSMPSLGCQTGGILGLDLELENASIHRIIDLDFTPTASVTDGGLRSSWQTVTLDELDSIDRRTYWQHAAKTLGPILTPEPQFQRILEAA